MAVSGKTAAPILAPYFLDSDKPPNMATVTKAMSDRQHALIEAFGLDDVLDGTAASGQLLIAQPGDVARFRAMSGDVSVNSSGVTQIGNSKLATGMYQDGSVTPKKLAALGVTAVSAEALELPTAPVVHIVNTPATVKKVAVGGTGQMVTFLVNTGPITFKASVEAGGLKLASEFVAGEGDTLTLVYYGNLARWVEVTRSNNA
jgi:hypothetical protein